MLTHLDPARLAAVATAAIAAGTVLVVLIRPGSSTVVDTSSSPAVVSDAAGDEPTTRTPAAVSPTPNGVATTPTPASTTGPSSAPVVEDPSEAATSSPEPQPTTPPPGRTDPDTQLEQLAVDRLIADATGRGRGRWPDLTAPPCCDDLTITGIATTSPDEPPAPQTVVIAWAATDRSEGRLTEGVTTTRWVRRDRDWIVATYVATPVAPPVAPPVAAPVATQPPASGAFGTEPLLSGRLAASKAADNRHTPLIHPSECRSPRSWRGV